MKTTLDIQDQILRRAKRLSKQCGRPLRALVEEGLRHVLETHTSKSTYDFPDCSVGEAGGANPLEQLSWQELRAEIYGAGEER